MARKGSLRITFHDPCCLGRHNKEYMAPRLFLGSLPGVECVAEIVLATGE